MQRKVVQREFDTFMKKVDINQDGKIDRWELYQYCLNHMKP